MPHDETYVLAKDIDVTLLTTEDDTPLVGVLTVTTPSGDCRRILLTEQQADELADKAVQLSCDLILR